MKREKKLRDLWKGIGEGERESKRMWDTKREKEGEREKERKRESEKEIYCMFRVLMFSWDRESVGEGT